MILLLFSEGSAPFQRSGNPGNCTPDGWEWKKVMGRL